MAGREATFAPSRHARRGLVSRFADDVPILAKLPPEELFAVAEKMREATFAPGQTIMTQGDRADYFYVLEEGAAKATVRLSGGTFGRRAVRDGELFRRARVFGAREAPRGDRHRLLALSVRRRRPGRRFWNSSPRARNSGMARSARVSDVRRRRVRAGKKFDEA